MSSEQQAEAGTIASQLRALREYVSRMGWQLVDEYVDDGKSAAAGAAKLGKRTAFGRLQAAAAAGQLDAVVINDFSRLTRTDDWQERGDILGGFQRAKVRIVEVATGQTYDLSSGIGDLLVGLRSWVAADDNRRRVEAMTRGAVEQARRGGKPRGQTPYGYTWTLGARDARGWGVDPERAAIVREVFSRVAGGESCRAVARDLERRQVPPPRRGRASWTGSVVRLVHHPVYRGAWLIAGVTVEVPRLVDDDVWFSAQAKLAGYQLAGLRRTRSVYLCEGLARCGVCGCKVYIHREQAHAGGKARYHCKQRQRPRGDTPPCTLPMMQVREIDAVVWEQVRSFLAQPREAILRRLRLRLASAADDAEGWAQDAAGYRTRLAGLDEAEAGILDRYARGLVSQGALDRVLRDVGARRAAIRAQLATAESGAAAAGQTRAASLLATLDGLRAKLAATAPEQRREVVRALVAVVALYPNEVRVRLVLGDSAESGGAMDEACSRATSTPEDATREQGAITLKVTRR